MCARAEFISYVCVYASVRVRTCEASQCVYMFDSCMNQDIYVCEGVCVVSFVFVCASRMFVSVHAKSQHAH